MTTKNEADTSHRGIAKAALGIEWENTESVARRVAEYAADLVQGIEAERDSLRIEAKGYADTIGQIQALSDKGLPIVIKGRRYVVAGWRDPATYAEYVDNNGDQLVQVLCEVVRIDAEGWDHVSIGDRTIGDKFVSIGFVSDDVDMVDGEWVPGWLVAGWNMSQDCFTDARGFRVIGWQPLSPINPPTADAMIATL